MMLPFAFPSSRRRALTTLAQSILELRQVPQDGRIIFQLFVETEWVPAWRKALEDAGIEVED